MIEELVRRGNEMGMWMLPAGLVFWGLWAAWQWVSDRWKS